MPDISPRLSLLSSDPPAIVLVTCALVCPSVPLSLMAGYEPPGRPGVVTTLAPPDLTWHSPSFLILCDIIQGLTYNNLQSFIDVKSSSVLS